MKQTFEISRSLFSESNYFEQEIFPKRSFLATSAYLRTKIQTLERHKTINERFEQLIILIDNDFNALNKTTSSSNEKAKNRRLYADATYNWACHLDVLRQFFEKCYLECIASTQPGDIATTADLDEAIDFNQMSIDKLKLALSHYMDKKAKEQTLDTLEDFTKQQLFLETTRLKVSTHEDSLEILPAPSKSERQASSNTLKLESEVYVILTELKNDPSPLSLDAFLQQSLDSVERATHALIDSLNQIEAHQFISQEQAKLREQSEAYLQTIIELKAQTDETLATFRSSKRKNQDAITDLTAPRKKVGSEEHDILEISNGSSLNISS